MTLEETIKEINRPKRVAVCTAWGSPFIWTHGAYNMMNLIRPEGIEFKFLPGWGWCPARRHMYGVELALNWGATHICFLGADQLHPVDILVKFCSHIENGWPAVTALIPVRGWVDRLQKPFQTLAWKWKKEAGENIHEARFNLNFLEEIDKADGDHQEVVAVGSGALMFDVGLMLALKKPWFQETVTDDHWNRQPCMDTFFSWRLCAEAGARILCDCTIDVKHLDIFPIDESYGDRFPDFPRTTKEGYKTILGDMQQPRSCPK